MEPPKEKIDQIIIGSLAFTKYLQKYHVSEYINFYQYLKEINTKEGSERIEMIRIMYDTRILFDYMSDTFHYHLQVPLNVVLLDYIKNALKEINQYLKNEMQKIKKNKKEKDMDYRIRIMNNMPVEILQKMEDNYNLVTKFFNAKIEEMIERYEYEQMIKKFFPICKTPTLIVKNGTFFEYLEIVLESDDKEFDSYSASLVFMFRRFYKVFKFLQILTK